jgi:hypothetical protein
MSDVHDVLELEGVAYVQDVLGVAVEVGVTVRVVGFQIRLSRADVVEQDDLVIALERWGEEPPKTLTLLRDKTSLAKPLHLHGHRSPGVPSIGR